MSHGGGRWSQINQKCHILFEWFLIRLERKLKGKKLFHMIMRVSWDCKNVHLKGLSLEIAPSEIIGKVCLIFS
jgi:hypothetical protein